MQIVPQRQQGNLKGGTDVAADGQHSQNCGEISTESVCHVWCKLTGGFNKEGAGNGGG